MSRYRFRSEVSMALVFVGLLEIGVGLLFKPNLARAAVLLALGFPIGLLIGFLEVWLLPRLPRRLPLAVVVGMGAGLHLFTASLAFTFVHLAGAWLQHHPLPGLGYVPMPPHIERRFVLGTWESTQSFALYFLCAVGTTALYQLNRKLGPRVLGRLLSGRFLRPVAEHRIFLFLDLKNSTGLAEQLGEARYSQLISDCFYDLSEPVVSSHGEIYQYVGDEAVISWPTDLGLPHARCLACFFAFQQVLVRRRAHYLRHYGVVPEFKAGLHLGRVMVTQVGDVKSELVYHGDVLNTAARIQSQCNALGSFCLISDELRQQLSPHPAYRLRELGEISLRGRQQPARLFDVQLATGS